MALSDGPWTYITAGGTGPPYGALHYTEAEDSGSFDMSAEDASAEVVYQVDDQYRFDFTDDLLGYATFENEAGGNYDITRILPEEHAELPNFFAVSAKGKRKGKPSNQVVDGKSAGLWTFSRIESSFKPLEYAVVADGDLPEITYTDPDDHTHTVPDESQRFVTWKYNYVIQQLSVQGLMQFVTRNVNKALDTAPGFATVFLEKEVTWHQVPARTVDYDFWVPPNQADVLALAGTINKTAFMGHEPGTVLFMGYAPRLRKPNLSTGLYTWDIVYRFLVKDDGTVDVGDGPEQAGPNFIFDTLFERYDLITSDGTLLGKTIYEETDLNALFAFTVNS